MSAAARQGALAVHRLPGRAHRPRCTQLFRRRRRIPITSATTRPDADARLGRAWTSRRAPAVAARDDRGRRRGGQLRAREQLRLVVKGGGHSYQGTSNAPDSLLVWTRRDGRIAARRVRRRGLRAARAAGAGGHGRRRRDLGAGLRRRHDPGGRLRAGRRLPDRRRRRAGPGRRLRQPLEGATALAAASLLEAEVVTADGEVRIVNACTHPDLFWAPEGRRRRQLRRRHPAHVTDTRLPELFGAMPKRKAS